MNLKEIFIYPIKSIGGIPLNEALCTEMGLEHDRRMMLADGDGVFISQREFPKLAQIGSKINHHGFVFFDKSNPRHEMEIPFNVELLKSATVKVWNHEFAARQLAKEFSDWFGNFIGHDVFLYKMDEESKRNKSLIKAPRTTKMSMADGYPYLVISDASLNDLNSKLDKAVPMDRFRPNLVFQETEAYQEESMDKILIGEVPFRMIKPCARCTMITINQKTSEKLVEPLKTLSLYKKKGNKVYFGMNAVSLESGMIRVGDVVTDF